MDATASSLPPGPIPSLADSPEDSFAKEHLLLVQFLQGITQCSSSVVPPIRHSRGHNLINFDAVNFDKDVAKSILSANRIC